VRNVRQRRGGALAAVLGIVVVLATACSGNSGSSDSASGSSASVDASVLGDKNAATGSPVKIGLYNVEGGSAVSQPNVGDAAQAAADYANEYLGGIGGHKIDIVRCADKADGASAAACANTFVQEKVAAVVAGQPAITDQIVPVIQGAGIPWVGSSPAGGAELADDSAYFFSSGFIGLLGAEAVYSKQKGYKNVTMIGAENPQLVGAVTAIGKPLFQGQGVTLNLVTVPQGTADATSQVTAATQSKPDAVSIVADNTVCQSVLSALSTIGATQPTMVNSSCTAPEVMDAVGESGIDGITLFTTGDTTGDNDEAKLYQAVMKQYASDVDPGGITPTGYLGMLGFVRAVNAGNLTGDPTPASVTAAVKAAKDVPLPIGQGKTFSCDATAFPSPAIKATICNSLFFVTTFSGLKPGPYDTVDAAQAVAG
jgi:branched-chain amino acid transport system substrate-binding protein